MLSSEAFLGISALYPTNTSKTYCCDEAEPVDLDISDWIRLHLSKNRFLKSHSQQFFKEFLVILDISAFYPANLSKSHCCVKAGMVDLDISD